MFTKKLLLSCFFLFIFIGRANALENDLIEFKKFFDKDELNYFLSVWPEYSKWSKENKKINKDTISDLKESSTDYSEEVVKWMEPYNISVDRFFYLKERINLAIRSCLIKKEQDKISSALNAKLLRSDSEMLSAILEKEIEKAKSAHLIYGISEGELNIVCPNLDIIEKIMSE